VDGVEDVRVGSGFEYFTRVCSREDSGDDCHAGSVAREEVVRCVARDREVANVVDADPQERSEHEVGRGAAAQLLARAQGEVNDAGPP
jgi:hypothetical protein